MNDSFASRRYDNPSQGSPALGLLRDKVVFFPYLLLSTPELSFPRPLLTVRHQH
jgi:hypothetical protein